MMKLNKFIRSIRGKDMNNVNVINNIGKDVNITVNENLDKIEIVIDLASKDFKLPNNLKFGDVFKDIDGEEWIFLCRDMETGNASILKKEPLQKMKFSDSNNNYNGCSIDKYLCNTYLPELERKFGKDNIVEHEVDLLSLDGENDYGVIKRKVSIPTLDVYRYNKKAIKEHINEWFWLCTPNSTPSGYGSNFVQYVISNGDVSFSWYSSCGSVRPFLILKDSVFEK